MKSRGGIKYLTYLQFYFKEQLKLSLIGICVVTPSPKEQFHVPFRQIVFPKKGICEKIFF